MQVYTLRILELAQKQAQNGVHIYEKKLRGEKLYQAVARFISSNIRDIILEKLSEEFHYQEDYYNRLIKKNTEVTYSEYLSQMRMEKAKNRLLNTELSVQDIRIFLGYSSHSYFYRVFQKETGMPPQGIPSKISKQ